MFANDAKPHTLSDHHGMLPAKATIIADEGYGMSKMSNTSGTEALQRRKYIVDLRPDNETDPPVRLEVHCWVSWITYPKPDDVVAAGYKPGGKEAALLLAGDERFDWRLRRASEKAAKAADRDGLLAAGPDNVEPNKPS